jgi:hypothetical protein
MNELMWNGGKSLQLDQPSSREARRLAPSALKSFVRRTDLSPRFAQASPAEAFDRRLGYRLA